MRFAYIVIAVTVSMLSACASGTYRYGERTFSDRKEAEAAQKADLESMRGVLKPRSAPVAKSARIVIPSKTALMERGLRPGGTADARDYVATMSYSSHRFTAESVRYRNIFERVEIEESTDPGHVAPKAGEAVIYFYLPDNKTVGWYYISGTTKRTPIHFDSGNPDRGARFKYFIDSIEALASDEPK
jgi:hypothetical protein